MHPTYILAKVKKSLCWLWFHQSFTRAKPEAQAEKYTLPSFSLFESLALQRCAKMWSQQF